MAAIAMLALTGDGMAQSLFPWTGGYGYDNTKPGRLPDLLPHVSARRILDWGANAVNGVISIITRSSKDTKGGLVTAAGGSQTRTMDELQYGGAAGQNGASAAAWKR